MKVIARLCLAWRTMKSIIKDRVHGEMSEQAGSDRGVEQSWMRKSRLITMITVFIVSANPRFRVRKKTPSGLSPTFVHHSGTKFSQPSDTSAARVTLRCAGSDSRLSVQGFNQAVLIVANLKESCSTKKGHAQHTPSALLHSCWFHCVPGGQE